MRRSPFYSYPAYDPFRNPHTGLYANDAYHPPLFSQQQRRPSSTPASSPPAPRKVINVPVFDSAAPPSAPSPASPKSKPSVAYTAPSIDPASAATLIQACFRGFFIRRHRPLAHLRTIFASRKQLEALKAELESPGFSQKVRSNEKERLRFSESVMAVILRLDAIEGSVPEIRSQRKEATKMAIRLQDAIDAIMSQKEEEVDSESANILSLPEAGVQTEKVLCEVDTVRATTSSMQDGGPRSPNDATSQEATVIIPGVCELMVQEHGLGSFDVNIAQETATTIRGEGPDSHDSNVIQEKLQDGDSIPSAKEDAMQVLEDGCMLQDKAVSMSNVQEGECVKAMDDIEHKVELADQEENIAQGKLVEAMNILEEHDKQQAPHHDGIPHLERHEVQAADSDVTCALEENGHSSCANKANQENVDVVGLVVNGDVVIEKLQECQSVRQDDETSAKDGVNLSFGTPRAEEGRPNAVKSSTDHYTTEVEQFVDSESPCATEQLKDKSSRNEASVVCGNGLQHLDRAIPTDCALPVGGGLSSSDHELLKHLSEECGQLRSLIGRLLAQNKAQSKVICALGDKLEMLEQQQQLISAHNNQQNREKRKPRKGAARKSKMSQL